MKMIQCSPDLESETREDTSPRIQDQCKIVICMVQALNPIKKVQVFITLLKNKEFKKTQVDQGIKIIQINIRIEDKSVEPMFQETLTLKQETTKKEDTNLSQIQENH